MLYKFLFLSRFLSIFMSSTSGDIERLNSYIEKLAALQRKSDDLNKHLEQLRVERERLLDEVKRLMPAELGKYSTSDGTVRFTQTLKPIQHSAKRTLAVLNAVVEGTIPIQANLDAETAKQILDQLVARHPGIDPMDTNERVIYVRSSDDSAPKRPRRAGADAV